MLNKADIAYTCNNLGNSLSSVAKHDMLSYLYLYTSNN